MSCVNSNLDRDQTFNVHDFGPKGHVGTVLVNLTHGLQPGAMIGAVVLTDQEVYINVYDGRNNVLLHFAGRVAKNQLIFNARIDDKWFAEEEIAQTPLVKGVRASVSVMYETEGFRIFINGKEQKFYKHRSNNRPDRLEITHGQVYKVIYHTTVDIIP